MIDGTIVTDDAAATPVKRAKLTLIGSEMSAARVAISDDSGHFSFPDLPSGSFSLTAEKPSYVRVFYGSKRPGRGPGAPLALADAQHVSVSMKMLHGAAITGTVTDASGRPAVQLQIQAVARIGAGLAHEPQSSASGTVTTDDRGVFRIYGLAPGDYIVCASPRFSSFGDDLHIVTSDEVQWAQGRASGSISAGVQPPPTGSSVAYTYVYFPGTADFAAAATLTLAAGDERNASFAIRPVAAARIDGSVTGADGQPAQRALIQLVRKAPGPMSTVIDDRAAVFNRTIVVDGKFALLAVAPGSYTVSVRGGPGGSAATGGPPERGGGAGGGPGIDPNSSWWGEADIVVDGHDQSGLSIVMQPAMTISGKLILEGLSPPPNPLTRVRIGLESVDPARAGIDPMRSGSSGSVAVAADGSFAVPNVIPGRYNLRASNAGGPWTMKSATVDGHDVADAPLVIAPGRDVANAVVTITDKPAGISGVLYDAAGRGTPEFSIVAFSTDRAAWANGSRRVRVTRPNTAGAFDISGLPPGEYYLAALANYETSDLADPLFLEQVAATSSYKITLADGEHKTQDLKISGG